MQKSTTLTHIYAYACCIFPVFIGFDQLFSEFRALGWKTCSKSPSREVEAHKFLSRGKELYQRRVEHSSLHTVKASQNLKRTKKRLKSSFDDLRILNLGSKLHISGQWSSRLTNASKI